MSDGSIEPVKGLSIASLLATCGVFRENSTCILLLHLPESLMSRLLVS